MAEVTVIQMGNQYNDVIMLDEYNGQYSVVAARESKDGKFFPQWVFPQDKDRQPREKAIPLKVTLGNKEQAVRHLRYLADSLEGQSQGQSNESAEDSDVPF